MGPRPSVRSSERGVEASEWQSFPLSGLSQSCPLDQGPEPKDPAPPSPSLTGSPLRPSLACSPKGASDVRLGVALVAGQERTWPALLTATWEEQAAAASWSAVLSRAHMGTKLRW
ncbi:unnamed protein product [Rangifer tarandus platyrhynchus]|uniref:Uncharacterized protein n=1 Tax=Rangifer tarandus platyrhynchus TaxID=3082113 RepID=A0AC59YZ90_RANTA